MVLPLMSCGARLPIYALMIPAFFAAQWQGPVLWVLYVTGILVALIVARLLRAIYRPHNYYCLHLDRKAPPVEHDTVRQLAACFHNV